MQLEKLQAALVQGRKRISVKQLCKEVQLDRADVLQWLKHYESAEPSVHASVLGAKKAAIEATEERQSILSGTRPGDRPARQKEPRERLHYKPGFEPHTPGSAPWAANYGRKKLPRSAEATLERIFDDSPHPSEAVVKGLFDLHRLPRRRVLDWFAQRRRERSIRNNGRSASGQAHD
ncbi:g1704 [Coccomyxa elongata]